MHETNAKILPDTSPLNVITLNSSLTSVPLYRTAVSTLFVGLAETINEVGPGFVENSKPHSMLIARPSHHTTYLDIKDIFEMIGLVLGQKAVCQLDPDQEASEEQPEDQAEEDSMLISAASDVVASLASALGSQFAEPFRTFFPLIIKYYVRLFSHAP